MSESPGPGCQPAAGAGPAPPRARGPPASRLARQPARTAPAAPAPAPPPPRRLPPAAGRRRRYRPIGPLPARLPRRPLPLAALRPPRESWRPLIGGGGGTPARGEFPRLPQPPFLLRANRPRALPSGCLRAPSSKGADSHTCSGAALRGAAARPLLAVETCLEAGLSGTRGLWLPRVGAGSGQVSVGCAFVCWLWQGGSLRCVRRGRGDCLRPSSSAGFGADGSFRSSAANYKPDEGDRQDGEEE